VEESNPFAKLHLGCETRECLGGHVSNIRGSGLLGPRVCSCGWLVSFAICGLEISTKYGPQSFHFFHPYVIYCTQVEFVHGGRWSEVDIIREWSKLQYEGHIVNNHFLR